MKHVATQAQGETAAEQSERWRRINSAMAGIANAIELCSEAGLESITDRLLALQVEALKERERV
jgi:hypothetical protein